MASSSPISILLIGPLPNLTANKIGGARVSFSELIQQLQQEACTFQVINTKPFDVGWKRFLNPLLILWRVFRHIGQSDLLFLNVSQGGTKLLAPLLFVLCRLSGKKFVFRPFGGSLKAYYQKYNTLQKWIFHQTVLKADLFFLQTKELVHFLLKMGGHIQQLPTSRSEAPSTLRKTKPLYQKRFVFIGHVKASKGIQHLLEAQAQLGDGYTIHLYGPIQDPNYEYLQQSKEGLYRGMLKKEAVLEHLQQYDVLVLPTFFSGEGYPGAIIEAYSLGMPVIATQWKAIPEIVKDGQTGFLIPPQSTAALVKAMQSFNKDNYLAFSAQAHQYFSTTFNAQTVTRNVLQALQHLLN